MHGIILESELVARAGGEATTQESKFDQCRQMLDNFTYSHVVIAKVPKKPRVPVLENVFFFAYECQIEIESGNTGQL